MTAVRRSTRSKRQANSIYDEAKKQVEARKSLLSKALRKKQESDDEEEEEEEPENVTDSGENSSDDDDNSDEEVQPVKPKAVVKSPRASKAKPSKSGKITVKMGKKKDDTEKKTKAPKGEGGTGRNRAVVLRALALLEKKVTALWQEGETKKANNKSKEPKEDSLVLSLLGAAKQRGGRSIKIDGESPFTPQLEEIARKIIKEHKLDSTKAQIKLVNLLFRSVGGSPATDLNEEDDLNLNDEQWEEAVTNLVEEMRHTPENAILLCADPDGAVHAATQEVSSASLGAREYRKIYEEFWYVLGRVALTEGVTKTVGSNAMDESDDDDSPPRSSLFEVELVRDIVVRMSELVTVGQPDIRAAATIAVLQLGFAALDRTVALSAKLDVATRQLNAATKGKITMKKKEEGLRLQIDSLKRSRAELEEMVAGLLFQGVFLTRYRDSNMHIRAFSIQWLSRLTISRPDIFLMDKYLKYLGWMMSDKAACVRQASIMGLLAPFKVAKSAKHGRDSGAPKIELSAMENVAKKFLPRIADCVIDVGIGVQETAMELFLALMQEGFLYDCDDDNIWNQVNVRAMDPTTSPAVRRNALYLVIEQLDAFQSDDGESKSAAVSEKAKSERLDSIATWVAHNLSDGKIPPEQMRIGLTDLAVHSLLEMPEHKELVTDWPVVLRAIRDAVESNARAKGGVKRTEATKQRVLLQMLACAANAQVHEVSNSDFLSSDADEDVLMARAQLLESKEVATKKKHVGQKNSGNAHDLLSAALLKNLADFFLAFRGDVTVLKSLTALPRCLLPSVFSLPTHKDSFISLIKRLSDLYLETSDDQVLENIACSLTFFARGDHARKAEAQLQLKDLTNALKDRLRALDKVDSSEKPHSKSATLAHDSTPAESNQSSSSVVSSKNDASISLDNENSMTTCLKRLRVLSKRFNIAELLEVAPGETTEGSSIETFCTSIGMIAKTRLDARQIGSDTDTSEPTIPNMWTTENEKIHDLVAKSVNEALSLLLSILAHQTSIAVGNEESEVDTDDNDSGTPEANRAEFVDHFAIRLRGDVVKLLQLCWEQCLDGFDLSLFSEEHIRFADAVQQHACHISGDLRSLFPKEWADSPSTLLRAFALTDDGFLVGGSVRYLRSQEEELRSRGDDSGLANNLLLPLCRGLTPNWLSGNRREAGAILAHITGSGQDATDVVTTMSRVLKKIEPLRLLESHMACLRQSYEDWLECEPEELESDRPSEEEMEAFEEAEKRHVKKFETMGDQADRLSKSLGVGKLSDPKLSPAILEFVKEGIRFAFSDDEELELGSRLYFLSLIGRYAIWIRRDQGHRKIIESFLTAREAELAEHPDFDTLTKENLDAIDAFKEFLEMKPSTKARGTPRTPVDGSIVSPHSEDDERSRHTASPGASTTSFRRRMSHSSSVSTKRSRMSAQSSLSPLYEEDGIEGDGEDEEMTPTLPPSKKRKVAARKHPASLGSQLSVSTLGKTQTTIDEGNGEHSDGSSE